MYNPSGVGFCIEAIFPDSIGSDGWSNEVKSSVVTVKKESDNIVKLIEPIDVVCEKFENHFEVQKKRYTSQKRSESTKQYCNLKMLVLLEPSLGNDAIIKKGMEELKIEMEDSIPIHPSPARKKNCSNNNMDKNGSVNSKSDGEDESSISSIQGMEIPVVLENRYDSDGNAKNDEHKEEEDKYDERSY